MTALLLGVFTVSFLFGWPVVLSILGPSVVYVLSHDLPIELIGQRMSYALDSFPLVAVPVFIFVGNLMNQAGVTERIFRFADTLVGRIPGGLAQVNVFASLIFSGMSGAALADVGGLGRIEVKAMTARGFRKDFSSAITVASAIVGPIFPPSIPLIIYGSVTNVSIIQLLLAGIVPALICVALLMITVAILALRRDYPRSERWPTRSELWRDLKPAIPALLTPVMLIAGMLLGIFTPTEAAIHHGGLCDSDHHVRLPDADAGSPALLGLRDPQEHVGDPGHRRGGGPLWLDHGDRADPQMFTAGLLSFSKDPLTLLLVVNLILLVVGMFLDSTTATLLVIPILSVPLHAAGVDPVHLGIVAIFNLMVGLLTPPMGLALFLISDIAKVSMRDVLRELVPFYVPLLLTLAIITLLPELTLWLPKMIR